MDRWLLKLGPCSSLGTLPQRLPRHNNRIPGQYLKILLDLYATNRFAVVEMVDLLFLALDPVDLYFRPLSVVCYSSRFGQHLKDRHGRLEPDCAFLLNFADDVDFLAIHLLHEDRDLRVAEVRT